MDKDDEENTKQTKKTANVQEDPAIAKETLTATRMLNVFRQMEEQLISSNNQTRPELPPLKCFTPPRDGEKKDQSDASEEDEEDDESDDDLKLTNGKGYDPGLAEAQKAARAKQLRAKFEKWEVSEQKKNGVSGHDFVEGEKQVESTKM